MNTGEHCTLLAADGATLVVELGWKFPVKESFEIDAYCFLLTQEKRVRNDKDFIFYNQPSSLDGSVVLNPCPEKSPNNNELYINLSRVPQEIVRIVIAVTIYQAEERLQNFSMVDHLYIRIKNRGQEGQQLAYYELHDTTENITQVLGNIYRFKDQWNFCAGGQGLKVGLDVLAEKLGVNIITENAGIDTEVGSDSKRGRRATSEKLEEAAQALQQKLISFLPKINTSIEEKDNESKTRMILDRIFTDAFQYKINEIKVEQKIQGRKADYVLSVEGTDILVVEVKRAGMMLREKQIFQATSYGAYSGIRWALLTNLEEWQVYSVTFTEKVEAHIIFSVKLNNGPTLEDCKKLVLISRDWINKKNILEKVWNETQALNRENVIKTIISEEIISKIRSVINKHSGCSLQNEDIQKAVEEILGVSQNSSNRAYLP